MNGSGDEGDNLDGFGFEFSQDRFEIDLFQPDGVSLRIPFQRRQIADADDFRTIIQSSCVIS